MEYATHFKIIRAVKSVLIKLIPLEFISDYHLDSYCLHFFKDDKELSKKNWIGTNKYKLKENKIYPISKLPELNN